MKKKSKAKFCLKSLKLKIWDLINEADKVGLHDISYKAYNASQNVHKNNIIKKFIIIESDVVACMLQQEKAYLFLENMLKKFDNEQESIFADDVLELFLNTDKSLIKKSITIKDKIIQALQLLRSKISEAKKTLLDIYYIHRTIESEACRIGWQIPQELTSQLFNVIDKYFLANTSYAVSDTYYLLKQINDEKNFDKAFFLYYNNMDLLLDVTFIKVNYGQNGTFIPVNLYEPFLSIENVSENLYSPFYGGKVNFVSGMATQRIKNLAMTQRNISLDSNTVSFIRTIADGHLEKLPPAYIKSLISSIDIIKKASSFDYLPYILENYVFCPSSKERILKTVESVESYFFPDNKSKRLEYYKRTELILKNEAFIKHIKKEYYICYALLLLICFMNFKLKKMKTQQKLENFCLYMDKIFFLFREPFVEIAYNFFEHQNQYRFFSKIQTNAKNIIKNLRNMSWDIFHLEYLEILCSTGDEGADLFVPYFYCFDKGLLELKECFDLETLFVSERTGEKICFYHKHSYPLNIIEKYKSIEEEKTRKANFSDENIITQIDYLEREINSLW